MTVSQFLAYLNETFKAIWDSTEVAIEGEVSGYKVSQGQWASFDLKDAAGLVNVFLPLWKMSLPLQAGMTVRVFGCPRVYAKYGKFSFHAERVEFIGEGGLQKALALLRAKLVSEGLLEPSRKRPLPRFPERIALIASRDSAAYGDFIRIVQERWSGLQIDVYHVTVQGERAPPEIVQALQRAQAQDVQARRLIGRGYDALVMTRGGGSLEELMAFQDERVVRAVYACQIPTLVAIGHERDLTLAEEVADVRGSTPTDCARRLVPDRAEILYALMQQAKSIDDAFSGELERRDVGIDRVLLQAQHWFSQVANQLTQQVSRTRDIAWLWFADLDQRLMNLDRLLHSFDPRAVLERGYAIIQRPDGHAMASVAEAAVGDAVAVQLKDGRVDAMITQLWPRKNQR